LPWLTTLVHVSPVPLDPTPARPHQAAAKSRKACILSTTPRPPQGAYLAPSNMFWTPKQNWSQESHQNDFNTQPIMQLVKKTALTFITSYENFPFFKGLDCAFQIEIDKTAN